MKNVQVILFTLLAVLVVSSTISANAPTITIDGLDDDWASFQPVAKSQTGETKLFAFTANNNLYVMVKGPMGDWNDIQINSDGKAETGHQSWIWPNMGSDFLLEDGSLFKSTGPEWEWEEITETAYASAGEGAERVIEMMLPLELIGLTDDATIFIGFAGGGIHAPKQGDKPVKISKIAN